MKRIVSMFFALLMVFCSASALAAGKLRVTQENFHFVTSWTNYGYVYARVENVGDRMIKVNAGVLELYDDEGEVLTSSDYLNAYATYLQPGEYTYVRMYDEIEEGKVASDYMLTLTGKSDKDKSAIRLPVVTKLELDVTNGWWQYNYMYATVTNNTEQTMYNIEVVLALLDEKGNILHLISENLFEEVGLEPGSSLTIRKDIGSTMMEYFQVKEFVPISVDAVAYVLVEND